MGNDSEYHSALSRDEVIETISNHLKTKDFRLLSYDLKASSDAPQGFLGIHFKLRAEVQCGSNPNQTVNYFIKKIPSVPSHHTYALGTGAFYKEIKFYSTVVKDWQQAKRHTRKWCPEFYFSRNDDIFIVEDLSVLGFEILPERTLIPLNCVIEAAKSMAVMHSAALCFEEKLKRGQTKTNSKHYKPGGPVTFDVLYPDLMFESEASDDPNHVGFKFYEAGIRSQLPVVDLIEGYSEEQRRNIKEKLPEVLKQMLQLVKPSPKYRNIFLHGDPWANNIMFRRDKNGDVTDVAFIDFQLARFAPPAHDLRMLLHLVQTQEFREKHEKEVLDAYYQQMTEELKGEGFNIEDVYPRQELDESYKDLYAYGVLCQVMYFQMILTPSRINAKFLSSPELFEFTFMVDRSEMIVETFRTDELCRTRISEAMHELIQHYKLAE